MPAQDMKTASGLARTHVGVCVRSRVHTPHLARGAGEKELEE